MQDLCAVVLAAGEGTRLRPLTSIRPKALCPVGNVALVDHAIARVCQLTPHVAVNVGHGREQLEPHLAGRAHVSVEAPRPLGTAGALVRLREWIGGRDVVVHNADAWLPGGLRALLDGWDRARLRMLTVEDLARSDFGSLRFAGASLMPWSLVAALPADAYGLYDACWRAQLDADRVEFVHAGSFIDCGTVADYHRANMQFSGGDNVVADDASVEGTLERTVVWPGARVERWEHLRDAIRAPAGLTVQAVDSGFGATFYG